MKILIFEDHPVLEEIIRLFNHLQQTGQGQFELMIAVSVTEAEARLQHVNLAILDVTNRGRDLAYRAFNKVKIPVIGLTMNHEDAGWHPSNGSEIICKLDPELYEKIGHAVRECQARLIISDRSLLTLQTVGIEGGWNN
jgi:hypothetical protein